MMAPTLSTIITHPAGLACLMAPLPPMGHEEWGYLDLFRRELSLEGLNHPSLDSGCRAREAAAGLASIQAGSPGRYAAALQGFKYEIGRRQVSDLFSMTAPEEVRDVLMPVGVVRDCTRLAPPVEELHAGLGRQRPRPPDETLPPEVDEAIGEEARRLRVARGLSQTELGLMIGFKGPMAPVFIAKMETGGMVITGFLRALLQNAFLLEDDYFDKMEAALMRRTDRRPFVPEKMRLRRARHIVVLASRLRLHGLLTGKALDGLKESARRHDIHLLSFVLMVEGPKSVATTFDNILDTLFSVDVDQPDTSPSTDDTTLFFRA